MYFFENLPKSHQTDFLIHEVSSQNFSSQYPIFFNWIQSSFLSKFEFDTVKLWLRFYEGGATYLKSPSLLSEHTEKYQALLPKNPTQEEQFDFFMYQILSQNTKIFYKESLSPSYNLAQLQLIFERNPEILQAYCADSIFFNRFLNFIRRCASFYSAEPVSLFEYCSKEVAPLPQEFIFRKQDQLFFRLYKPEDKIEFSLSENPEEDWIFLFLFAGCPLFIENISKKPWHSLFKSSRPTMPSLEHIDLTWLEWVVMFTHPAYSRIQQDERETMIKWLIQKFSTDLRIFHDPDDEKSHFYFETPDSTVKRILIESHLETFLVEPQIKSKSRKRL